MIEFEINGKKVTASEGTTIIEAADQAGEYIPRFCYHKKLSVAANCRMCLVEVEKSRKPLPACATPITPDMQVNTKSPLALQAQRDVMEFLLINHPLDCPICDQGGECELQDLSLGYGRSHSEYDQPKRAVFSEDIGPLIETELTRCIQCTRCVRFGEEVAGLRELGILNRGEKEEIGTYVSKIVRSEMSGNVIDLCPVGALTNKPARYETRPWEIKEREAVSPHDCLGTNMYVHTRSKEYKADQKVFRAVPRENEAINETWISDRDRYSVEGLYHKDRILKPLMKKDDQWVEVEWPYALDAIAHLTQHIQKTSGEERIAGLTGYHSTVEEYYLFQKFIRGLGSSHIDHRLRETDFKDQASLSLLPTFSNSIPSIESADAVLLLGSNIRFEQPVLSTRLFKASQDSVIVMAINPIDYAFVFPVKEKVITHDLVGSLKSLVQAVKNKDPASAMAQQLLSATQPVIYVGAFALRHPAASDIRYWIHQLEQLIPVKVNYLTEGPNSAGAWIAGCVPHRGPAGSIVHEGYDAKTLLTQPMDAYFLLNCEIELDAAYPEQALNQLKAAKLVVCLNTFITDEMKDYADFILPITPHTETEGTYVNCEGLWQTFPAVATSYADAKPAWKVLRALANIVGLTGFSYQTHQAVRDSLKAEMNQVEWGKGHSPTPASHASAPDQLIGIFDWALYNDNPLVRRAEPLQQMLEAHQSMLRLHSREASRLNVKHLEHVKATQLTQSRVFSVYVDDTVAPGWVVIPAGIKQTAGFGEHFAPIAIEKI